MTDPLHDKVAGRPRWTIQRWSLGLGKDREPKLTYDMTGPVVLYEHHAKALRSEERFGEARVRTIEQEIAIEREVAAERAEGPKASPPSLDRSIQMLKAAVEELRQIGWDDGDIAFAAELEPTEQSVFIAGRPDQEPTQ